MWRMPLNVYTLCYFVEKWALSWFTLYVAKSVLTRFTHFCVEKNWAKNLGGGEKWQIWGMHWGEWAESPFMWNASWQNGKSPFVWNASWQNGKWPNKGYNWVIVGDTWIGLRWRSKTLQPTSQNEGKTLSSVHFLPTGCWSCWKWVKEHSGRWVTSNAVTQVSLSNVL